MNEKLDNINLTLEEKEVIEQRLKSKKRKQRTAKFLLSLFALTTLSSCNMGNPLSWIVPDWFKAMTNQDTGDGEDESDIAQGIGARFKYSSDNDTLSFKDVFEENVKSMDASSYIGDYYELYKIVDSEPNTKRKDNVKEILYTDLGLTEDDIMYYKNSSNGYKTLQITESGGEKLKNNPEIINLWYYNSTDKYQPSYYLTYFLKAKNDWKNVIRPELHDWFINKVKKEQEAILKTNNTKWALANNINELKNENVENIDLASSKGYIPYKLGISFLNNPETSNYFVGSRLSIRSRVDGKMYENDSLNTLHKYAGGCDYIYYGSKNAYGNSSLPFNNLILEAKYNDFSVDDLLNDTMQYDDYRSLMLTAKRNVAINKISYDIEIYNVLDEETVSSLNNKYESKFGMEVGEFRLEQLGTYRNYAKRNCGSLVGPWLATQNAFRCGTNYFNTSYVFEEKGQTKYWEYCSEEEQANYYFDEGKTYHIEIDGVPTSLIDFEDEWTSEKVDGFRLVIPKGCNLNLKVELKGKNRYCFYKIKNLKIDYDVVDSWDYISKNTQAWRNGCNVNYIYEHY